MSERSFIFRSRSGILASIALQRIIENYGASVYELMTASGRTVFELPHVEDTPSLCPSAVEFSRARGGTAASNKVATAVPFQLVPVKISMRA